MASWIVLESPRDGRLRERRLAVVRDGFSFLAFLFPPLWLLWHRLWIAAIVTFAVLLAVTALGRIEGLAMAASWLSLLVSIFVGLEGNGLRVAALQRRGWSPWGVVQADNEQDAETRYVADVDDDGDGIPDRYQMSPSAGPVGTASGAPVGLLLNPGR